MCGRYNLRATPAEIAQAFSLFREEQFTPRYNIAPTQAVPVIRQTDNGRELSMMTWGLIPSWSKDAKGAARLINARADTVATKPSFRTAFKKRRCLIPATAFYEWKGAKPPKQPYAIGLKTGEPFAFAGLWEFWKSPDGEPVESCTIITTEANELVADLHDRMPVFLGPDEYDPWLDPECDPAALQELLDPFPDDLMSYEAVSTFVNNARNEGPECVTPASD
jgi:putative SOS response-associated peptidase YedK